MTRIAQVRKDFEARQATGTTRVLSRLLAEGRRGQDDDRVQPRGRPGPARPADRARSTAASSSATCGPLLKVPADAPSILDLPTDRIAESDLGDVLWRDPSGIDILLAPPRIEMAEMLTARDVEKILSLLRRVYAVHRHRHVLPAQRHQPGVPRRERRDHRDRDLRLDHDPQHDRDRRHVPGDRLPRVQGPLPGQPRRLVGRDRAGATWSGRSAGSPSTRWCRTGGSSSSPTTRACRSCWPTRRARSARTSPGRPSRSSTSGRVAALAGRPDRRHAGPATDRGLRLRGGRADRAARDPPPLARRVDDLPRRQRAGAVRHPLGRGGPGVLDASRSTPWPSATSRRSWSPATPPRPSALGALRRRYDLPILGVIRPGASAAALASRNRRVGVIATPATIRSHAYFTRDQGREPGGRGLRARDAGARAAGRGGIPVRPGRRDRRRRVAGAAARRARRLPASSSSRSRPARRSTRCSSAAPTIRCSDR